MQIDLDSFIVWLLTQLDTDSGDAECEARMSCHGQMRKRNSYTLTAMKKVKSLYNKSVRTLNLHERLTALYYAQQV